MTNCFIYRHIRLDKNEPFYIGKGTRKDLANTFKHQYYRAFESKNRNVFWNAIVKKTDYRVEILYDDLTNEQAFEKEREFINIYGRTNLKLGTLANLSDGGEGNMNYVVSDKTRLILKQKAKEQYINSSPEHKEKMRLLSASRVGEKHPMFNKKNELVPWSKDIINTETLEVIKSVGLLSRLININRATLSSYLNGSNKNPTPYCYLEDYKKNNYKVNEEVAPLNNCKKVINVATNEVFDSIQKAANSINITKSSLHRQINGSRRNQTPMCYLKDYDSKSYKVMQPKRVIESYDHLKGIHSGGKNPSAKKVINVATGEIFGCAKDVATKYGYSYKNFSQKLLGKRKNNTNFKYIVTT